MLKLGPGPGWGWGVAAHGASCGSRVSGVDVDQFSGAGEGPMGKMDSRKRKWAGWQSLQRPSKVEIRKLIEVTMGSRDYISVFFIYSSPSSYWEIPHRDVNQNSTRNCLNLFMTTHQRKV